MGKDKSIVELSKRFKLIVDHAWDNFNINTKEDVIGDDVFTCTVHVEQTSFENKYVYNINDDREFICLISDANFQNSDKYDVPLDPNASFIFMKRLLMPLFDMAHYFQKIDPEEIEDNIDYEWETFVLKFLKDKFKNGNISTDMNFPLVRIIQQTADVIVLFYMADYNKVALFTLNTKDNEIHPEQDILDYLFENVIGINATNSNIDCNNCCYNPLLTPMHQSIANNQQKFAVNNTKNNADPALLEPGVAASLKIVNKYY